MDGCTTVKYPKTHWTVQFKWVNCIVCELPLNKAVTQNKTKSRVYTYLHLLSPDLWVNTLIFITPKGLTIYRTLACLEPTIHSFSHLILIHFNVGGTLNHYSYFTDGETESPEGEKGADLSLLTQPPYPPPPLPPRSAVQATWCWVSKSHSPGLQTTTRKGG